jgi:hypothetical protein
MTKKVDLSQSSAWQSLDWDEKPVHPNLKRTDAQVNVSRANKIKAENPEWLALKKMQNADPIVKAKRKASMPDQSGGNNSFFGKKHTDKTKKQISKNRKGLTVGEKNPFYGKQHSDTALEKMSKPRSEEGKSNMRKPRTQMLTCPHCGKTGASGNMARYHMDNCKFKD